jgi:hypothetical protein
MIALDLSNAWKESQSFLVQNSFCWPSRVSTHLAFAFVSRCAEFIMSTETSVRDVLFCFLVLSFVLDLLL